VSAPPPPRPPQPRIHLLASGCAASRPYRCLTRPNGEPIDEHLRRFDDEGFVRAISHPFIEAVARQILRSERVFMTETVAQYRPAAGAPGDRLPVLRNQPWDPKEQWRWGCHIVSSPLPTHPHPCWLPHQSDQSGRGSGSGSGCRATRCDSSLASLSSLSSPPLLLCRIGRSQPATSTRPRGATGATSGSG